MSFITRIILILIFALPSVSKGDIFHYANVLAGDRAMGLGGAFTAISDDASGVIYNPAGLAFALSNDISASANAFYMKETKYKKTLGNNDFRELSDGSVAPFFGGMQKLDHFVDGLSFGVGIQTVDSELKNQNDLFKNVVFQSGKYNEGTEASPELEACYSQKEDQVISQLARTVNARSSTQSFGAAVGYRLTGSLAIGAGLSYVKIDELVQEFQGNDINKGDCSGGISNPREVTSSVRQNIRTHLKAGAIVPILGAQFSMNSGFSFGLSLKPGVMMDETYEVSTERTYFTKLRSDNSLFSFTDKDTVPALSSNTEFSKPIGAMPLEMRMGMAWFANQRLLVSMDVSHFTESKDGNKNIGGVFDREAVTNLAVGAEYYVSPSYPLRLGFFTNNDAREEVDKVTGNSRDHIDYKGISAFITKVTPNDQVAVGTIIQVGQGQAQKVGGTTVQEVEAQSAVLAFSVSNNF